MARSYARIDVTIWRRNKDWLGLSHVAQWLYFVLLTDPDLSMVGRLPLMVDEWATRATFLLPDEIDTALRHLERTGFLLVDRSTFEVVLRTFVRHDRVFQNVNSGRGAWAAWERIRSETLAAAVLAEMPAEAWDERFQPRTKQGIERNSEFRSNEI